MAEARQSKGPEKGAQSIIRIAGRDVNGALPVERALSRVKGIGINMAHALAFAIEKKLSIVRTTPIGNLTEKQISDIESLIKAPSSEGIPAYMLNKRKDSETGKDMHFVGNDLTFSVRQDINREVNLKTWRGFRHQYGQRVRGQHTRSTGRTGATVGVMKKTVQAAMAAQRKEGSAPAAAPAGEAKKPAAPAAK